MRERARAKAGLVLRMNECALRVSEWIGLCLNERCQIGRACHLAYREDCV